jgi:RNA polymerase sigma-70 factor (ECF subfamily)
MSDTLDNERFRKLLLSLPEKAMKLLYDLYYHRLVRIAFELTGDDTVAEDIAQETFVAVWKNARKLAKYHPESIQHYLVKIVRNKSVDHFRENFALSSTRENFFNNHVAASERSAESQIIRIEINRQIRQLIESFPQREKECLLFRLDEDLSPAQIADRLSISVKSVERALTSGKKRFKQRWASMEK